MSVKFNDVWDLGGFYFEQYILTGNVCIEKNINKHQTDHF